MKAFIEKLWGNHRKPMGHPLEMEIRWKIIERPEGFPSKPFLITQG